jgi:outer membrane protein assembly factor BamB
VAGSNSVRAFDPATGKQLWYDTGIGAIHWESPIVANGALYITDENGRLTAYAPNGAQ